MANDNARVRADGGDAGRRLHRRPRRPRATAAGRWRCGLHSSTTAIDPRRLQPGRASRSSARVLFRRQRDPCGADQLYAVPLDDNNGQGFVADRLSTEARTTRSSGAISITSSSVRRRWRGRTTLLAVRNTLWSQEPQARADEPRCGDTMVFGSQCRQRHSRDLRSGTSTRSNSPADKFFDGPSLGIPIYTYVPGVIAVSVTNGFAFSGGVRWRASWTTARIRRRTIFRR